MKKTALCAMALVVGFGMMCVSYFVLQSPQRKAWELKVAQDKAASQTASSPREGIERSGKASLDPATRVPGGPFQLYMGGLALLMAGGSGLFIRLYKYLSVRLPMAVLRDPLDPMQRYATLFVLLHIAFFGGMILFMELAFAAPDVQGSILTLVKHEVLGGKGPLGAIGSAYLSKSIPLAALVTVTANFLLGSLLVITVPAIVVPGAGLLVPAFRAAICGLTLAPTFAGLSGAMLPHSFTLLMEGEGYILATFFGLLVPIYLFRTCEGPTIGARYCSALLLNVKGNLWILIVLAVSAIYEATEVIIAKGL